MKTRTTTEFPFHREDYRNPASIKRDFCDSFNAAQNRRSIDLEIIPPEIMAELQSIWGSLRSRLSFSYCFNLLAVTIPIISSSDFLPKVFILTIIGIAVTFLFGGHEVLKRSLTKPVTKTSGLKSLFYSARTAAVLSSVLFFLHESNNFNPLWPIGLLAAVLASENILLALRGIYQERRNLCTIAMAGIILPDLLYRYCSNNGLVIASLAILPALTLLLSSSLSPTTRKKAPPTENDFLKTTFSELESEPALAESIRRTNNEVAAYLGESR